MQMLCHEQVLVTKIWVNNNLEKEAYNQNHLKRSYQEKIHDYTIHAKYPHLYNTIQYKKYDKTMKKAVSIIFKIVFDQY